MIRVPCARRITTRAELFSALIIFVYRARLSYSQCSTDSCAYRNGKKRITQCSDAGSSSVLHKFLPYVWLKQVDTARVVSAMPLMLRLYCDAIYEQTSRGEIA